MSERVTILHEKWLKAKTKHVCQECFREVLPGEKYYKENMVYEGRFHRHKTCAHCYPIRDVIMESCINDGLFYYGGLSEDLHEIIGNINSKKDSWRERLLYAGMQRKWKRKDGKMWRINI